MENKTIIELAEEKEALDLVEFKVKTARTLIRKIKGYQSKIKDLEEDLKAVEEIDRFPEEGSCWETVTNHTKFIN